MENYISDRLKNVPKSFIREILKVAADEKIISFAGGLPNPKFFPVKEIQNACNKVLEEDGANALQYSTTEGYLPLREYIARRYKEKEGIDVSPEEIIITSGSQQGLDLIGKTFIDEGENVLMEKPGYLGAIQAFSVYGPNFCEVTLEDDGVAIEELEEVMKNNKIKLFYTVPNFQNPSGITYSAEKREKTAVAIKKQNILMVEDNPYGDLRFIGETVPSMKKYYDNTIILGSFSKIIAPSFRLGWIYAKKELIDKLVVAKQASDLHTNYFSQRIIYQYLLDNDMDKHIEKIIKAYGHQREAMIGSIEKYFPEEVKFTRPEGGMFLWVTLPENIKALDLFYKAIEENVAFVPGFPFYAKEKIENTFRLNYSNVDAQTIDIGIKRLADTIKKMM
jgi:2-aminoadipate transaminase